MYLANVYITSSQFAAEVKRTAKDFLMRRLPSGDPFLAWDVGFLADEAGRHAYLVAPEELQLMHWNQLVQELRKLPGVWRVETSVLETP